MKHLFLVIFLVSPNALPAGALTYDEAITQFENFEIVMSFIRASEETKAHIQSIDPDVRIHRSESLEDLTSKINENPYNCKFGGPSREVMRRGKEVIPYLIDELSQASDYYRLCLIEILSEFSDETVYVAFVDQLEGFLDSGMGFLSGSMISVIMRALSLGDYSPSVEVLKKYLLEDDVPSRVRSEARIALAGMSYIDLKPVSYELYENRLEEDHVFGGYVAMLEVLIGYEAIKLPMVLNNGEMRDSFVRLEGELCGVSGHWWIEFESNDSDLVPFYYTWYIGPLEASGYIGILQRKEDQWLMVFWRRLWIS